MSISFKKIKNLPDTPGVYFFVKKTKDRRQKTKDRKLKTKDQRLRADRDILYIGKATSLRDRVESYFSNDIAESRGPLIVKMLDEATGVDYEKTDSVLEALILEAALIKKHQPRYNSLGKDNKTYNYVVITKEDYPRVFTRRGRDLLTTHYPLLASYGPFPHGTQLKEALRIVRKIFPFRGEKDAAAPTYLRTGLRTRDRQASMNRQKKKRRSALNQELGLAPDFGKVTKQDYARTIRHIKLFFEGKKKHLVAALEREMKAAARKKEFERAAKVRGQLFALEHIRDVSLLKSESQNYQFMAKTIVGAGSDGESGRVEAYDVAHTAGTETVGVMTVIENSEPNKNEYRKFKLSGKGGDTGGLREVLERRFKHAEWHLPRLIVVDGGKAQLGVAERALKEFGYRIPVVAVTKNERHRPKKILGGNDLIRIHERDILLANSEAHRFAVNYHRKRRGGL